MLTSFKIRNFKSILDMTVELDYNEGKAPNNWKNLPTLPFLKVDNKNRFVPVLALFGANASGKSNVIEAILTWQNLIYTDVALNTVFHPNKLNKKYTSTMFEAEFFINADKFKYIIEYNQKQIISEKLFKNNKTSYHIALPDIFDMSGIEVGSYNTQHLREFFNVELAPKDIDSKQIQIRPFFTAATRKFPGLADLSLIGNFLSCLGIFQNNKDYSAPTKHFGVVPLEEITSFIRKLDIDIINIFKKDPSSEPKTLRQIYYDNLIKVMHKDIDGNEVEFDMDSEESLGTNVLFGITELALCALKNGGIFVIDELDRSLHPLLLTKIVELFKDKDYNKKNAQLIFTCHSTDILENKLLRLSEVAIVTKTLKDGSTIRRLSEFEGVRNAYDFRKMYLDGNFGGIPYPYI